MKSKRLVSGVTVLVSSLAMVDIVSAQTVWTAGTGNWNTAANWTLGVPNAASATAFDAVIENGGTAELLAPPSGSVRRLRVGRAAGTGNLLVDAAILSVTENLHLNEGGAGKSTVTVRNGASVTSPVTIVGHSGAHSADLVVTGAGTTFNAPTQLTVGTNSASGNSLYVENGADLLSGAAVLAPVNGSFGDAYIRNPGSAWTVNGPLTIGGAGTNGTCFAIVQDQGVLHVGGQLSINGVSTLTLAGTGSTLRFDTISGLNRLNYLSGTIQLTGGRNIGSDSLISTLYGATPVIPSGKGLTLETFTTHNIQTTLQVNGGSFTSSGSLIIGSQTAGALHLSNSATANSAQAFLGFNPTASSATVASGSTWTISDILSVGTFFPATLSIQNGIVGTNTLELKTPGTLNLSGGTLRIGNYTNTGGTIRFDAGTIHLTGNRTVGSDQAIRDFFGGAVALPSGKGLTIDGTATLQSIVSVNGGTLSVGQIANGQDLQLIRGTLSLTNQVLTIGSGGPLGSALHVNDDMSVNVPLGINNQGLVTGGGQIGGTFANAATGELRAEPGRSLTLTGANNTNAGRVNLLGGLIEFTQNLTSSPGGLISGNGSLIVGGGLVNQGTMNFAGTANVLGDVTNAVGGKIVSGGGGATIFYDDVINNGEIRTSTNAFTIFFGNVTSSGTFTGAGTKNFEGGISMVDSIATPGSTIVEEGAVLSAGHLREDALTVRGLVKIDANGTAAGTSKVNALSITGAGKMNLSDNKLIVANGALGTFAAGAYTGISGLIDSGRGNASSAQWDGVGIVTSDTRAVNNNDLTSLGVARAGDINRTTFGGLSVAPDDVLVMFTWGGDANLDGKINIDDYGRIDGNVGQSGSVFGWFNGDFNYDGKINIDDYGIIDGNINRQGPAFATAGTPGVAAVPEPGGFALVSLAGFCAGRRGRRQI